MYGHLTYAAAKKNPKKLLPLLNYCLFSLTEMLPNVHSARKLQKVWKNIDLHETFGKILTTI